MNSCASSFANPALQRQLDDFLSDPDARVRRLEHEGAVFWAKKSESFSLRWRLQKGDPLAAFQADLLGLKALSEAGVSVPEVVAQGQDFLVMRDSGTIVSELLRDQNGDQEERIRAMQAAGQALAALHALGLSHGRPAVKDMCWDGAKLTFLDFERYAPKRNTPKGHMQDLIIWVHSCFAFARKDLPEIEAGLASYRAGDKKGTWERAEIWCRRNQWLDVITKPLQRSTRNSAREFQAIPMTMRAFGVAR